MKHEEDVASTAGPVELVTVPALGPEWKAEELHNMTKAAKRERRTETWGQAWTSWNRGEIGCCGRVGTRKHTVYFFFVMCIMYAVRSPIARVSC